MTASASSQSRSLKERRSISHPGGRRGAGCGLRQRRADHCLRKAQSAGENDRYRPLGQGIRLLQPAAVRKKRRCGGREKRFVPAWKRREAGFPRRELRRSDQQLCLSQYHRADKQALLRETLRVLKKGGTFAIHDLMSPRRYGDMQAFVQKLRNMGYERVELMDTTDGSFMTPKEAGRLMLRGSTLLVGRK